jgi:hypothetical protein
VAPCLEADGATSGSAAPPGRGPVTRCRHPTGPSVAAVVGANPAEVRRTPWFRARARRASRPMTGRACGVWPIRSPPSIRTVIEPCSGPWASRAPFALLTHTQHAAAMSYLRIKDLRSREWCYVQSPRSGSYAASSYSRRSVDAWRPVGRPVAGECAVMTARPFFGGAPRSRAPRCA